MWNTGAAVVQVASILIALSALVLAYRAFSRPLPPPPETSELEKAFRALEHDSQTMWEKVESHLGRVSRLKRDMKPNVDEILEKARLAKEASAQVAPPATDDPDLLYLEWKERNRA